mgnify:CR=1 FL=1
MFALPACGKNADNKTENNVILPAYKSQFRFEHSKPIKEGGQ